MGVSWSFMSIKYVDMTLYLWREMIKVL
jgi:hypothetical protein